METEAGFPSAPRPAGLVEIRLEDNFARWVAMGEGRTFKALAGEVNMPVTAVVSHAKRFNWRQRLGAISTQASQMTMERMVESVAHLNEVHVQELRRLRKKALDALIDTPLLHSRDQIKLYFEAEKMERQILGLDADADKKDLADLLMEKLKTVQARVLPSESDAPPRHEFELEEGMGREPLETPSSGEGDEDEDEGDG